MRFAARENAFQTQDFVETNTIANGMRIASRENVFQYQTSDHVETDTIANGMRIASRENA